MPYNRDMAEAHWLTPVGSDNKQTAEMVILALVGAGSVYGFDERTPGRSKLKQANEKIRLLRPMILLKPFFRLRDRTPSTPLSRVLAPTRPLLRRA